MAKRPNTTGTKRKPPHNAKLGHDYATLAELVRQVGSDRKLVTVAGETTEMSWAERSLRLTIDRALSGKVRDLELLLKLMAKYPATTGRGRMRIEYFTRYPLSQL